MHGVVGQCNNKIAVLIDCYRLHAYTGSTGFALVALIALAAFISGNLAEVNHGVIGESNNKIAVFIDDNGFYTYAGVALITFVALVAFVTLDIGYNNGNEHIAVHRKGDFGLIDFGEQLAADVPALENIGRVKSYGCGKHRSLAYLVAAGDFFTAVLYRKNTAVQSRGECDRIFRYLLDFHRDVGIRLDCAGSIGIAAVAVVDPRICICKAVVFLRLDCDGDFIAVANGFATYEILVTVFDCHICVLRAIHHNRVLLDFGEIHLNIGFGIHNKLIVILAVQLVVGRYGFNLAATGNDELLHTVIFRCLCSKGNFRADNNTRTRLITLLGCHCTCLFAACGRIGQAYTHGNIKFCADLNVLCNRHSEAFAALTLGVACPRAEFAACVSFDSECQFTINRNIHAVVVIQLYNIAVCVGDLYCTALCGDIYLYLLADFRKRSKFCFNSVFFRCQSQRIGV